jgi:hypothetical protein
MIADINYFILLFGFLVVGTIAIAQSNLLFRIRKQKMVTTKRGTYTFVPSGVKQ